MQHFDSLLSTKRAITLLLLLQGSFLVAADLADTKPSSYVTDAAGVLDPATKQRIENLLIELKSKTSAEVAVVTVPSLGQETVEDYAVRLFKKWGIGEKEKDNGVLFLIAPSERKMRIEVGYGLEELIPDSLAGRILDQAVVPRFRAGDIKTGVFAGAAVLAQVIASKSNVELTGVDNIQGIGQNGAPVQLTKMQTLFVFLLFFFVLIVVIKNPWLLFLFLSRGGGGGGGFGGGGFGGFGGGSSGGGGASRGW